jgi:hypothetical protein
MIANHNTSADDTDFRPIGGVLEDLQKQSLAGNGPGFALMMHLEGLLN